MVELIIDNNITATMSKKHASDPAVMIGYQGGKMESPSHLNNNALRQQVD